MMVKKDLFLVEQEVTVATYESGDPNGEPIFFLHGNSLAADIFTKQLLSAELSAFRLVAMDLPGHGRSAGAPGCYSVPAMRKVIRAALQTLRLEQALVVAHSYAGLLFFDLLPQLPGLRGLLAVGAPPVTTGADIQAAFQSNDTVALYYTGSVTTAQANTMARYALGPAAPRVEEELIMADILRTDGRFRTGLGASLGAGELGDGVGHVARTTVPLALVAGTEDRGLHLPYFQTLAAPSRWGAAVHLIPGAGHAPFLECPEPFNRLLLDFAAAVGAAPVTQP